MISLPRMPNQSEYHRETDYSIQACNGWTEMERKRRKGSGERRNSPRSWRRGGVPESKRANHVAMSLIACSRQGIWRATIFWERASRNTYKECCPAPVCCYSFSLCSSATLSRRPDPTPLLLPNIFSTIPIFTIQTQWLLMPHELRL